MTITAEQLVNREVHYCVSHLVSTLASGYGMITPDRPGASTVSSLTEATEQAFELCSPLLDYEEAARDAGWDCADGEWCRDDSDNPGEPVVADSADLACYIDDIEPYEREVFEHWIVSDWLADKLAEKGEKVDKDFCGLTVWARTTTGQGIANDWVIEQIIADLNKPEKPAWGDIKVAFDAYEDEPVWGASPDYWPSGWSLSETDAAGARLVVVFRVDHLPTDSETRDVAAKLKALGA